ncbi:MAG: uL15 family ribosomal protein [Clostridia bacterium]|nr:uL15 family ribosomal protein [Clostridia bacterium]
MNLVNGLFLFIGGFDIFNVDVVGCAIFAGVCLLIAILLATVKCKVTYIDDAEGDEYIIECEKYKVLSMVRLRPAEKEGKEFLGWSLDAEGQYMVTETEFLLTRGTKLYAIWAEEAVVADEAEEEAVEGVFIQLNYMDVNGELLDSEAIKINTLLPEEQDVPVEVKGWSFEKNGDVVISKNDATALFAINLYPLFDENAEPNDNELDTSSVIELLFVDSETDKFIYKEAHYVKLNTPADYDYDSDFIGWGVEPEGEAIIEKAEVDSVFTLQLYSVAAEAEAEEELFEEIVEEPIVEEPVEEAVDEPAAEEPIEEPIEEPVEEAVEEPVEEPVYEVYEEAAEETAEEAVEEGGEADSEAAEDESDKAEEAAAETTTEDTAETDADTTVSEEEETVFVAPAPVIVPTYIDNEGNTIDIKYNRSFTANLIQSDEGVKDYYGQLKNHILSYKGVKSRISWKFDSYNRGRDQLFKMKLRGKTVLIYCAIDPNELDKSKYHHEAKDNKLFADVPTLLKVKSGLGLRKAKEVVDMVMAKFEIEKDEKAKVVDYVKKYPYEETDALIARKLVKALVQDSNVVVVSSKPKEEPVEEPVVEPVYEEPIVEPVVEEPIEEPVVEEPIEEPVVEEPIEEPVVEEPVVASVAAEEAHALVEEKKIEVVVEEDVDYITKNDTKKAIVNIDTLANAFEAGAVVDIEALKAKKLVDKKAKSIKVLARGVLDKPLTIKAGEFSDTALEMIALTGGKAVHVTYKVK